MDEDLVDLVIQSAAEVTVGGFIATRLGSQPDPEVLDLKRQLDDARKANRSLSSFLKDEFGLNDQQIAKARTYQSTKPAKKSPTHCPHCKQRLFSRNVPACNHCGGHLLPT